MPCSHQRRGGTRAYLDHINSRQAMPIRNAPETLLNRRIGRIVDIIPGFLATTVLGDSAGVVQLAVGRRDSLESVSRRVQLRFSDRTDYLSEGGVIRSRRQSSQLHGLKLTGRGLGWSPACS